MARRRKATPLEEEIFLKWKELAFREHPDGFMHPPEAGSLQRKIDSKPEYAAIFALAFDGQTWKVDSRTASLVSGSSWSNAMLAKEYDYAEEVLKLWLTHPQPFDRGDSASFPIMLQITRLIRDRSPEPARELEKLIQSGIYRPGEMTSLVYYELSKWLDLHPSELPIFDELRSLARSMAIAKRNSKRMIKAAGEIQTWQEFANYIGNAVGYVHEEPA